MTLVYALVVGADEVAKREGRLSELRRSCVTGREFMRLQHQLKELLIWLNYTLPGSMLLSACVHDLKYHSFPIIFLLVGKKKRSPAPHGQYSHVKRNSYIPGCYLPKLLNIRCQIPAEQHVKVEHLKYHSLSLPVEICEFFIF